MQQNDRVMRSNAAATSQSNMTQDKIFQQLQQVFNKSKQPQNTRMKNNAMSSYTVGVPNTGHNNSMNQKNKSIFNKQPTAKIKPKDRRQYQQRTAQPSLVQSEEAYRQIESHDPSAAGGQKNMSFIEAAYGMR